MIVVLGDRLKLQQPTYALIYLKMVRYLLFTLVQEFQRKVYTLLRRHYICKSSPDLSRHISVLLDPSGKLKLYQFIQYRFAGEEHSVEVKPMVMLRRYLDHINAHAQALLII